MEFPISQPKVVRLPRNEMQTYRLNSRPQMWPMVWIYQIVTGVTSVVGVPSTHLVFINTLRSRQDGRHFPDDSFRCIFLNENERYLIQISLKFVPKIPINNTPALVQIMAWHQLSDKPLSEPMMIVLLRHICVTLPQWVNPLAPGRCGCNLELVIFKFISRRGILRIACKIAFRWMPLDLTDD